MRVSSASAPSRTVLERLSVSVHGGGVAVLGLGGAWPVSVSDAE